MPRIIIKVFGDLDEDVYDLQDALKYLNFTLQIAVIDGKKVNSLDEFLQIASQPQYQEQEFIELTLIPAIDGG
jgi:hypothetical protein